MSATVHPFSVGPIVGTATQTSVRILGVLPAGALKAGEKRTLGRIRWRREGEERWRGPVDFRLNGDFDASGVVVLRNLRPDSRYQFQAGTVDDPDADDRQLDWHGVPAGRFRTAPDNPEQPVSFLFGSCCYRFVDLEHRVEDSRGDRIFSVMSENAALNRTDFVVFGGDQIYADATWKLGAASSQQQYFSLYRESYGQPHIRHLMANYNHQMILDDHEIENNWPANADAALWTSKYPAAMKAYQIYQASHSPVVPLNGDGTRLGRDPEHLWYTLRWGCADFFFMDLRTERMLGRLAWRRRMISPLQEQAVIEWLNHEPDRVKCLVSSVALFPDQRWPFAGKDAWEGFHAQRQRLIDAIRAARCRRLLVLTGDVHSSLYARLSRRGRPPIHSWICSGLFWPTALMAFRWYRPMIRDDNALRGFWKPSLGKVTVPGEVYSDNAFSRVSLDNQGARLELFDQKGHPLPKAGAAFEW